MRRFLPTIPAFCICFVGGMSFAPAVKDSKARLDVVSQWLLPGDGGYGVWKKLAEERKEKVQEAGQSLKKAEENKRNGEEMKALMAKIGDFEVKFKAYSSKTQSDDYKNLLKIKKDVDQANEKFDVARERLLKSQKERFNARCDLYEDYSKALIECKAKLSELSNRKANP